MSTSLSSFSTYRVAAIQYEPILGEKEKNVTALLHLVEEAAQHEARLIVLPEMVTTGYCWESRSEIAPFVEPIPGPTTGRFQHIATSYGCFIAISLPEVDPSTEVYYNSMALIGPEGLIGTYRKIHSYMSDSRWARDGDLGMPVWETPLGRLAALICMDAEFFESARIPALHGADVLLFPTNWLDENSPSGIWMARAFENGVYFIGANRYGSERGTQFSGGSCILNPDGSIQAYLDNGEGIVYGEVDLSQCRDKSWGPSKDEPWGNCLADRRPSEYVTITNNTYLWEPLRYHSLYELGELPPGQLSCVAIIQTNLQEWGTQAASPNATQTLRSVVQTLIIDHDPARPDVLVLPELILPGPVTSSADENIIAHFQNGAIVLPGPETAALVELANELQISLVIGVAERVNEPVPTHYLIWRVRAAEHNVYLALANWSGQRHSMKANGNSGIFSPSCATFPWSEVIDDEGELTLTMMTIDTREQRTGRRSSTHPLNYAPGDVAGSLTGELAYDIRDSIPGNVVRSKPLLRKRIPYWYLDLVKKDL